MFFSMCGSRPLKVNSWMNCLMWSWSFRVRHAPWLPAPPARLSESLAPFFSSVFTAPRVCRLPELLGISSWRGWLSRLVDTPSGRKRRQNNAQSFDQSFDLSEELNNPVQMNQDNIEIHLPSTWQIVSWNKKVFNIALCSRNVEVSQEISKAQHYNCNCLRFNIFWPLTHTCSEDQMHSNKYIMILIFEKCDSPDIYIRWSATTLRSPI